MFLIKLLKLLKLFLLFVLPHYNQQYNTPINNTPKCHMSYMRPSYYLLNKLNNYKIYYYQEEYKNYDNYLIRDLINNSSDNSILFIPGHAGSYKQVNLINT